MKMNVRLIMLIGLNSLGMNLLAQPNITQQPTNQVMVIGDNATFNMTASGTGPITYQWQFNGTPIGIITTVAGNGATNYSGDGGNATNATLHDPCGVAVDQSNQIFFGDYSNNRVRKVDTNGIITTVAGNGTNGFSGDGGAATNARLYYPFGLAVDSSGTLFIAAYGNNRIRKVAPNGIITTVAGSGAYGYSGDGGSATNASFNYPTGVAIDSTGNLFIVDASNNRVRKVDTNGIITTVAGNGTAGYSGDGSAATNAKLKLGYSSGVTLDAVGNLFIGDRLNNRIRKVDTNGIISTVAGTGGLGYSGDFGAATNAQLYYSDGVAVDAVGNLFIADTDNNCIRKVDTNGIISTVAGNGIVGYTGDGSVSTRASLCVPNGIALDTIGNIVFADTRNNRIRKVSYSGPPILILKSATTNDAGNYQVIISDTTGSVTSSVVALSVVDSPPIFTIQPTNRIALVRSNLTNPLFVAATIGSQPTYYQWQFCGTNIGGATNSSLVLTNVQVSNGGSYSVIASNSFGTTASSNAILSVVDLALSLNATNLIWLTSSNAPWIPVFSPTHDGFASAQSGALNNGQLLTLQTSIAGPGTLCFWWKLYNAGSPYLTSLTFQINGITQTNISNAFDWQQMTYYCSETNLTLKWIYTNTAGYATYNGGWVDQVSFVSGPTPASISVAPPDRTLPAGNNTTFAVTAFGTPPLFYQWQFNGTNISGAKSATFSISDVQAVNQGVYSVTVSNAFGTIITNAILTVSPSAPAFTVQPISQTNVIRGNAVFTGAAKGSEPLKYQWLFNGANITGATNTTLFLTSLQTNNVGNYQLMVSNINDTATSSNAALTLVPSMVFAWGNNVYGLFNIPAGLTNAIGISAGYYHNMALKSDGTVVAWGTSYFGETNVPTGLGNATAVSAGDYFSLALKSNGTVVAWGENYEGQTNAPKTLTNAIAISAGYFHCLALKNNGTVAAWGDNSYGETNVPVGLSNVVAVSAGQVFSLALKSDGKVIAWGDNSNGETNVPVGLSNVVAISAGVYSSLALKSDGTISDFGFTNFDSIPSGLTNVVAISAGDSFNGLALKRDGTVVGLSVFTYAPPIWLTNVVAISAGEFCNLAILNDGSPFIEMQPLNQITYSGSNAVFNVVSVGLQQLCYQWQFGGMNIFGATNSTLILTNIPLTSAGSYQCVVSNLYGVAISSPASLAVLRSTPQFDTSSSNLQFTSGGLSLQLNGLSGHGAVIIYASTNLLNWRPIFTNPPIVGTLQFLDSSATIIPAQFYRAIEQ